MFNTRDHQCAFISTTYYNIRYVNDDDGAMEIDS